QATFLEGFAKITGCSLSRVCLKQHSPDPIPPNEESDHPHVPGSLYNRHPDLAISQPGKACANGGRNRQSRSYMALDRFAGSFGGGGRKRSSMADSDASSNNTHTLAPRDHAFYRLS